MLVVCYGILCTARKLTPAIPSRGNATDLSLLTNLTLDDIASLQTVGRDAQAARKHFILKDDQHKVWEYIRTLKDGRVDFVLDNAGFEVRSILCAIGYH